MVSASPDLIVSGPEGLVKRILGPATSAPKVKLVSSLAVLKYSSVMVTFTLWLPFLSILRGTRAAIIKGAVVATPADLSSTKTSICRTAAFDVYVKRGWKMG